MKIQPIVLSIIVACAAPAAHAQMETVRKLLFLDQPDSPGDSTRIIVSPYTLHYSPSPNHRPTWMLGGEKQYADGVLLGAAYFSNSFGQDSATIYRGARLKDWGPYPQLYAQWTAGLMYGYKPPYNDEVPLNFRGFSPIAVLSLGWQFNRRYAVQLNALGTAALMFQLSVEMP
jgi:hypothetical protein